MFSQIKLSNKWDAPKIYYGQFRKWKMCLDRKIFEKQMLWGYPSEFGKLEGI